MNTELKKAALSGESGLTSGYAEEILKAFVAIVNEGQCVKISADWGGSSLTIEINGSHSHVGLPDGSFDHLIKDLHNLICKNQGLSFIAREEA